MKRIAIAAAAVLLATAGPLVLAHGKPAGAKPANDASDPADDTPFGRAGDAAHVARTVEVSMSDGMRYGPARIHVKTGETVRLVAINRGALVHELVIGTMDELKEHAALMKKFPNMVHDEPNMAHVEPGGRQDIVLRFTHAGTFFFACLQPGHFEAGMVGTIFVGR